MKRVVIPILLTVMLLVGCTSDKAEVERLQSRIANLEGQIAEQEAIQDKSKAIAQFAQKALEFQRVLMNVPQKWVEWQVRNSSERGSVYPRYKTTSKEIEAANELFGLRDEVRRTITAVELLYAPNQAIETKKKLLAECDSIYDALGGMGAYYASVASEPNSSIPASVFQKGIDFMFTTLPKTDQDVRRELTDLLLEHSQ